MLELKCFCDRESGRWGVSDDIGGVIIPPEYLCAKVNIMHRNDYIIAVDDKLSPHFFDTFGREISSPTDNTYHIGDYIVSVYADKALAVPAGASVHYSGRTVIYTVMTDGYSVYRLDRSKREFIPLGNFEELELNATFFKRLYHGSKGLHRADHIYYKAGTLYT